MSAEATETTGQRELRELRSAVGYSETEECGVDALIAYKNAVEDRLTSMIDSRHDDTLALDGLADELNEYAVEEREWDQADICNELVKALRASGRKIELVDD